MIETSELRIGNFVCKGSHGLSSCSEDDIIEVYDVLQFGINKKFEDPEYDYKDIYPIPLTEEWLLKFGFTKEYEGSTYTEDGAYFSPFSRVSFAMKPFTYTDGSTWFDLQIEFDIAMGYNDFLTPPEYVHQLQNLYFALTGTELTIKELVK